MLYKHTIISCFCWSVFLNYFFKYKTISSHLIFPPVHILDCTCFLVQFSLCFLSFQIFSCNIIIVVIIVSTLEYNVPGYLRLLPWTSYSVIFLFRCLFHCSIYIVGHLFISHFPLVLLTYGPLQKYILHTYMCILHGFAYSTATGMVFETGELFLM